MNNTPNLFSAICTCRKRLPASFWTDPSATSTRSASGISLCTAPAPPPGGPYKEGPGEINVPISCGGISVNPGDIILADPDGIICIPRKDAAWVLEKAKAFQAADEKKLLAARNGTANRAWVEKSLEAKGYEIIDDVYEP